MSNWFCIASVFVVAMSSAEALAGPVAQDCVGDESAYDAPHCVEERIDAALASAADLPERVYYVAISEADYLAQGNSASDCPFGGLGTTCAFGDDENTGLSVGSPFATFHQALKAMHDYSETTMGGTNMHFRLKIRGGDFYYREPLLLMAEGKTENWVGDPWVGPHLFDAYGEPIKRDDAGDWVYSGEDGYDDGAHVIANITVSPFRDEPVTFDGLCGFEYRDGDGRGAGDWTNNKYVMDMSCAEETSTLSGFATWFAGRFQSAWGLIQIYGGYQIDLRDLTVQNAPGYGVKAQSYSQTVRLTGVNTSETGSSGMHFGYGVNEIWVEESTVQAACALSDQENVTIAQDTTEIGFVGNIILDGYNDASLDLKNGVSDVYIYGNTFIGNVGTDIYIDASHNGVSRVLVDSNYFGEGYYARAMSIASETGGDVSQVRVMNNLSANQTYGFWIANGAANDAGEEPVFSDIQIVNNTVFNAGNADVDDDIGLVGYGFRISYANVENLVVANNIFSENHLNQFRINADDLFTSDSELDPSKIIIANNIAWCDGADEDEDGYLDCLSASDQLLNERQMMQVDPLFVDPYAGDFGLQSTSPALDAGLSTPFITTPQRDMEARVRGRVSSIGPLEY